MLCRRCSLVDALPPLSPRSPHFGRSFAAKCVMAHSLQMLCRFGSLWRMLCRRAVVPADTWPSWSLFSSGCFAAVSHRLLLRMLCHRDRLVFAFAVYLHCRLPMCCYLHVMGAVGLGVEVDCTSLVYSCCSFVSSFVSVGFCW